MNPESSELSEGFSLTPALKKRMIRAAIAGPIVLHIPLIQLPLVLLTLPVLALASAMDVIEGIPPLYFYVANPLVLLLLGAWCALLAYVEAYFGWHEAQSGFTKLKVLLGGVALVGGLALVGGINHYGESPEGAEAARNRPSPAQAKELRFDSKHAFRVFSGNKLLGSTPTADGKGFRVVRVDWGVEVASLSKEQGEELAKAGVTQLRFVGAGDADLAKVGSQPQLRRLRIQGSEQITTLALLRKLKNLQTLELVGCTGLTDKALEAIASLLHLRVLVLSGSPLRDAGLKALVRLRSLKTLDLSACVLVTGPGLAHLASLEGLRELTLNGAKVRASELKGLDQLDSLALRGIGLKDVDLKGFPALKGLRTLRLGGNPRLTGASLGGLARLPALTSLDLSGCAGLTNAAAASLGRLEKLESLDLSGCLKLGDPLLGALGSLKRLRSFKVSGSAFSKKALAELQRKRPGCKVTH